MEKKDLFKYPDVLEIPNANLDGSTVKFCVVGVGDVHHNHRVYLYRILYGVCGIRLEFYDYCDYRFLCQFQYEEFYEVYGDLMRFSCDVLDFEFNEDNEVVGKIYKYKEE